MEFSLTYRGHRCLYLGPRERRPGFDRLAAAAKKMRDALALQAREVAGFRAAMETLQSDVDGLDRSVGSFQAKTNQIDTSRLARSARQLAEQTDDWTPPAPRVPRRR